MDEKNDRPRKMSSCFEGPSFAELMRKIAGEKGIGSLCEEMMKAWMDGRREGPKGPPEGPTEEAREEKDDRDGETAQSRSKKPSKGGVK